MHETAIDHTPGFDLGADVPLPVPATMSSASKMLTPLESMVPSVRVKLATATWRLSGPMMGMRNRPLSNAQRPRLVANSRRAPQARPTPAAMR